MARPHPPNDLVKLVRAYGVLGGTCDRERTIAGAVSRRWIGAEVERRVPLASLPRALFRTYRGRCLLAAELYPDGDLDPESIDVDRIDIERRCHGIEVNTNRIPKLEPINNAAVLVANMLLGVRLYGRGGSGMPTLHHDLIVAAMLQVALDKPCEYGPLADVDGGIVDDARLRSWFGPRVAELARELQDYHRTFGAAIDADETPPAAPSRELASATAALEASRLRLVARAAGDHVIEVADPIVRAELASLGVDVEDPFPERPYLERSHRRSLAAFALPGVDGYALREPVSSTLFLAVQDVLDDPSKRSRLSGRRGKAVHDVHMNLPVMEYFAVTEALDTLETVHVASLEMMRYLEKGRRKSGGTMTGHAFRIASLAERVLGPILEPIVVTLAMLHDVVEDGSTEVTGYEHSLRKIQFRFGGPIAAMVSELTDSSLHTAGEHKARLTLRSPHLFPPHVQYNVDRFTTMNPRATHRDEPYTLAGIALKLLDTTASFEEGLRHPDIMHGHWRHSGARIYWAQRSRGAIVHPLQERMLIEVRAARDPRYATRPLSVPEHQLRAGTMLLETTFDYQDLYAVQNLAILASEFLLDVDERERLIERFFDDARDEADFRREALDALLDDDRLARSLAIGRLPTLGHTTLYAKGAVPGAPRDESVFLAYRAHALRRRAMRRELGFDGVEKAAARRSRARRVLLRYDALFGVPGLRTDGSRSPLAGR